MLVDSVFAGRHGRTSRRLALAVALLAGNAAVAACSSKQGPVVATAQPGDMPTGGDWTGVFYSPIYGHLHLVQDGESVSGRWRTTAGDKWGELYGTAIGDVLRFRWVEHKIGLVGPGAKTEGRGYFRYEIPEGENVNHELHGEWGLGRDEAGNPWDALRQRNVLPDLESVLPDETETINPSGWD